MPTVNRPLNKGFFQLVATGPISVTFNFPDDGLWSIGDTTTPPVTDGHPAGLDITSLVLNTGEYLFLKGTKAVITTSTVA